MITQLKKKYYFDEFEILPLTTVISFSSQSVDGSDDGKADILDGLVSNPLFRKILKNMANIDACPLDFELLQLKQQMSVGSGMFTFVERLGKMYWQQATAQMAKILGAMDVLGNPQTILRRI